MNTRHISLAFAAAAALLAGCAKSTLEEHVDGQLANLELTYVGATATKSAIDGTTFPTEGEIGLFLFKDDMAGIPYGESGYANVKYSYNSTKEKWAASPSMKVGSTPGYLYGYYPYSSTATDIKAIPIKSSLNGDDVMYAAKQTAITDKTASQTSITMNHALARVSITVVNKGYTGEAKLSKIKISGARTASTGTLNALDGSISAIESDVTLDITGEAQTITDGGTTYECLLVPSKVETGKQPMILTLTIDGIDKEAQFTGDNCVIIAQGTKSNITITLRDSGISAQTVSVEDWNVVEVGGHKVTIRTADGVDPSDILTKAYADGNNVIIKACSETNRYLKCTLPGGELCPQSKTDKLVYTFTLSDIESDITATIGYAKPITLIFSSSNYADWGTASFVGDCYEGHIIRFTATVKGRRCQFAGWQDAEGNKLDWLNPQDITLTSDLTVRAVFNAPAGVFSVSYDGGQTTSQVHFSSGNLWYGKAGDSQTSAFNFEDKQYEFHTYDSEKNTWGLFGWSTSGASFDYGMSTSTVSSDYNSGRFKDWGQAMSPGYVWRTLTIEEWHYLFNSRQDAAGKSGFATVGNVHGIIILPDSFTDPMKNDGTKAFVPELTSGWDKNVYTTGGNWEAMENAGAVFLPAAGRRYGSDLSDDGISGFYWSSSMNNGNYAYTMYFDESKGCHTDFINYTFCGCSVRLVTEYQDELSTE